MQCQWWTGNGCLVCCFSHSFNGKAKAEVTETEEHVKTRSEIFFASLVCFSLWTTPLCLPLFKFLSCDLHWLVSFRTGWVSFGDLLSFKNQATYILSSSWNSFPPDAQILKFGRFGSGSKGFFYKASGTNFHSIQIMVVAVFLACLML